MSSNLQNWLNCCELPLCWLCIYLHLKAYLVTSTRAGWPARSGWASSGSGGQCPAGRGHRAARGSRAQPGGAAAESRPEGADGRPRPAAAPHLLARRRCRRRRGAAPLAGAAGRAGSWPRSAPGLRRKRRRPPAPRLLPGLPRVPAPRAGAGETGRARRREPGAGGRRAAPAAGRGRCPAGRAARLPSRPEGWTLPPANAARSKGNGGAGTAGLESELPRARVAARAPRRLRGCEGAEPPGAAGGRGPKPGGAAAARGWRCWWSEPFRKANLRSGSSTEFPMPACKAGAGN